MPAGQQGFSPGAGNPRSRRKGAGAAVQHSVADGLHGRAKPGGHKGFLPGAGNPKHRSRCAKRPRDGDGAMAGPAGRTRSARPSMQGLAPPVLFTLANILAAIANAEPVIFFIDGLEPVAEIQRKLKEIKGLFRTTTSTRMSFKQVFEHPNGLHRLEEGTHFQWTPGEELGIRNILRKLFAESSPMMQSWDGVGRLNVFDNDGRKAVVDDVMMVTGNCTKMQGVLQDHGGVYVSRESQKVWCHYDDVHNFSFVLYGTKTFFLAPPCAVESGPPPDINRNCSANTAGPAFRKAVVSQGHLIYLPKNWWHEVFVFLFVEFTCILTHTVHTRPHIQGCMCKGTHEP